MISAPAIRAIFKRQWHLCLLAAVVALLYGSVLKDLVLDWVRDPDYGHGFIVPVFAGYALWRSRGRWRNVPLKPSNFGLSVILAAMALLLLGSLGAELFLTRMSLLLLLAGIVLPFILFTAYRALIGENEAHRRLARFTWPIWFYVALSGPVVYLMIKPFY